MMLKQKLILESYLLYCILILICIITKYSSQLITVQQDLDINYQKSILDYLIPQYYYCQMSLTSSTSLQHNRSSKKIPSFKGFQYCEFTQKNRLMEMATMAAMVSKQLKSSASKQLEAQPKKLMHQIIEQQVGAAYSFGNTMEGPLGSANKKLGSHSKTTSKKINRYQNSDSQLRKDSQRGTKQCKSKRSASKNYHQDILSKKQASGLQSKKNSTCKTNSQNSEYIKNLYKKYLGNQNSQAEKQIIKTKTSIKRKQSQASLTNNFMALSQRFIDQNMLENKMKPLIDLRQTQGDQICRSLLNSYDQCFAKNKEKKCSKLSKQSQDIILTQQGLCQRRSKRQYQQNTGRDTNQQFIVKQETQISRKKSSRRQQSTNKQQVQKTRIDNKVEIKLSINDTAPRELQIQLHKKQLEKDFYSVLVNGKQSQMMIAALNNKCNIVRTCLMINAAKRKLNAK